MEFKGTKGEWSIENLYFQENEFMILDKNRFEIGIISNEFIKNSSKTKANAQLIATAPELLKDAIDLLWMVKHHATHEEIQERVYETEKTINKALGK